ncbi:MAG: hypothetical protein KJ066_15835 [Acidobacteria bacterium]|nr:hypothetical protein [Acidobacteriota bacterium]
MRLAYRTGAPEPFPTLQIRVLGPDSSLLSPIDLRRLFSGRSLSRPRRDRILTGHKVVALLGRRVVGLAAFERTTDEIRVYELALEPSLAFGAYDIVRSLLEALELASLAGGCRRLVLLPAAIVAAGPLERLGFRVTSERTAGGWLEKHFQ